MFFIKKDINYVTEIIRKQYVTLKTVLLLEKIYNFNTKFLNKLFDFIITFPFTIRIKTKVKIN